MLGKQGSIVGKLILNLQLLSGILDLEVGVEVVRRAIALAKIYMAESEKLYAGLENGIGSQIQRLIDLAGRRLAAGAEALSIRDYQQSFNSRCRPSAAEVRGYFAKAESMGLGFVSIKGKTQEFKIIPSGDKVGTLVDTKGDKTNMAQTLIQQEVRGNGDKWGQTSSFLSSPQTNDSSLAVEPDDLIHPQPSESLAENENKGSCPHLSPLAPKPLINSGFEGDSGSPHLSPHLSPFESPVCEKLRSIDLTDIDKGSLVMARRSETSHPERAVVKEVKPQLRLFFDGQTKKSKLSTIRYVVEVLEK